MNRLANVGKSLFGASNSSTDANRLYSILLDTRASSESQNMYDIAEKLTKNEQDNAKYALEQLWTLKKNLGEENKSGTIDLLIDFYQNKLDVIRNKEEDIKKVSKDSRELIEEKRKRDAEIVSVKQEISDCSIELERLETKLQELQVKEQELVLIEGQLMKELKLNANSVVNGLYEIILASQDESDSYQDISLEQKEEKPIELNKAPAEEKKRHDETETISTKEINRALDRVENENNKSSNQLVADVGKAEQETKELIVPYPKSIVKTTRGVVIGEYYYNPRQNKQSRHYIFNSAFFCKSLSQAVKSLQTRYDQQIHAESIQMIQDAYKRISDNTVLHFEVSTNEIINKNSMKELWHKMAKREYDEVMIVGQKLKAKLEALNNNYIVMLSEQMTRYEEQ